MESQHWYGIGIAALVALCTLLRVGLALFRMLRQHWSIAAYRYALRHVAPFLHRVSPGLTWAQLAVILAYLTGNTASVTVGTNLDLLKQKTGYMALVNLIPLGATGRANLFTDMLGLNLETTQRMHRWIGRVAAVHSILHSILAMRDGGLNNIRSKTSISGYTVRLPCVRVLTFRVK